MGLSHRIVGQKCLRDKNVRRVKKMGIASSEPLRATFHSAILGFCDPELA
jgi:hypothetical protein